MYLGDDVAKDYEAVGQCGVTCGPWWDLLVIKQYINTDVAQIIEISSSNYPKYVKVA